MKRLTDVLFERQNAPKACLMAQLPTLNESYQSNFRPFVINKDDIYDDDDQEFGIEMEPHITILYGIDPAVRNQEIEQWIKENITEPIKLALREISLFENDDKPYDVVKWDIDSEDLVRLNESVRSTFPYTSDFPDYTPHATVLYTNKGLGKKYCHKPNNPMNLSSDLLKFSKPNGQKLYFKI